MNPKYRVFVAAIAALIFSFVANTEAKTVDTQVLTPRQQGIITISAFTANGDLEKLKTARNNFV